MAAVREGGAVTCAPFICSLGRAVEYARVADLERGRMTYISGALLMAFCGLVGLSMDHEHAAEAAVAIAALVILAAEWCIFVDGK